MVHSYIKCLKRIMTLYEGHARITFRNLVKQDSFQSPVVYFLCYLIRSTFIVIGMKSVFPVYSYSKQIENLSNIDHIAQIYVEIKPIRYQKSTRHAFGMFFMVI